MVNLDEVQSGQIVYCKDIHNGWGIFIKVMKNPEKIKLRKEQILNLDKAQVLCYSPLNKRMVLRYFRPEELSLEMES